MGHRSRLLSLVVAVVGLSSCAQFVEYTDEIVDRRTGRSFLVTAPATAGGFIGFMIGIPADIAALPVTFSVYTVQQGQDEVAVDPISTLLFPSFVLWRAGTLVALPIDLVYGAFSMWGRSDRTLTEEEQMEVEYDLDLETLPRYPVQVIYPENDQ